MNIQSIQISGAQELKLYGIYTKHEIDIHPEKLKKNMGKYS